MEPMEIEGAWVSEPRQFADERGSFLEWFTAESFASATGHDLDLRQANLSVSAAGVVRGIHFAQVPPSQAKYVICPAGSVLDVVVDLRVGSPTFGQHRTVLLDGNGRRVVYVSEGLGHAFMALEDNSVVTYLCSAPYSPEREFGVDPMDPALAIAWPKVRADGSPLTPILSPKDGQAPSAEQARQMGLLSTYAQATAFREQLRR